MLDDSIGQIVAKLTSLGILNDTIIAFTSDNGGAVSKGGSNYPLRGMKVIYRILIFIVFSRILYIMKNF